MLRNLPNNYTRDMFLSLLDEEGLSELYDFVYLPMDFCRDANLGYAFVNLVKLGSEMVGWFRVGSGLVHVWGRHLEIRFEDWVNKLDLT